MCLVNGLWQINQTFPNVARLLRYTIGHVVAMEKLIFSLFKYTLYNIFKQAVGPGDLQTFRICYL